MSLALYRKYRPGRLDEVIGQDHVVEPLKRALASDRVHHAYLFSGPRGCGKTSSARILARSLNCEKGPTPEPCGVCNSCVALAPNGSGSIDVIEMDAATHGLVDDARDLREKAVYAPAASQFKIYIIDEAHQLGPGAANALLKLVEEPPPHLRFIFATTEPDKIIGTIRSRTHHYGFRLVSSKILQTHLSGICAQEKFQAEPLALALVARAAGGSVRDSLSILGQLIAGSGPDGLTYAEAAAQLGVTDSALIDELVAALATADGAQLFRIVDKVVEAGHDPRHFVTDLLDRLRNLLIVAQVPDAAEVGLIEGPSEQVAELVAQAALFGPNQLSRCADVVSRGLAELKGATAPRLQLELLMARVILPAADSGTDSLAARVEALERGRAQQPANEDEKVSQSNLPLASDSPPPRLSQVAPSSVLGSLTPPPSRSQVRRTDESRDSAPDQVSALAGDVNEEARSVKAVEARAQLAPEPLAEQQPESDAEVPSASSSASSTPGITIELVQAQWPAVLDEVKAGSRVAWMMVVDAQPISVSDGLIIASHSDPGTLKRYADSSHQALINSALSAVIGSGLQVRLVDGDGAAGAKSAGSSRKPKPGVAAGQSSSQDAEVADSVDADDVAGIELVERELGAVKITEYDGS